MIWITAVLILAIGLGCGTYLVVTGHPWFALLVFVLTTGIHLREKSDGQDKK